jgi:hypothetical protein
LHVYDIHICTKKIVLSQAAIQKQDCGITWCDYSHVMWLRWLCTERDNFDSSISTYIKNRSLKIELQVILLRVLSFILLTDYELEQQNDKYNSTFIFIQKLSYVIVSAFILKRSSQNQFSSHLKARRFTFSCNKLSFTLHTNLLFKNAYSRKQTKSSWNLMRYRLSDLMKYHSSNLMRYHSSSLMRYHSSSLMKYRSSDLMKYNSSNLTRCCLSNLMSRFRRAWWVALSSLCHLEKSS